jgi:CubicO group peptidase (beta-lactamase class C family)
MQRRDFIRNIAVSSFGCGALRCFGADNTPPAIGKELTRVIPILLEQTKTPGLSMALVRDGRLFWRGAFGVKSATNKIPVDHNTSFEAASVSKTLFAYVVMKLCENGTLALDTPLTKYAADLFPSEDARFSKITARHVLCHATGFSDWRSRQEPLKCRFEPGTQFEYSGEGYFYLQTVVSRLIGHVNTSQCAKFEMDFEVCATDISTTLKNRALNPFGMGHSGYVWTERWAENFAEPHDPEGNALKKAHPLPTDAARYASAGGLNTTTTDYAKFLAAVLDPKPANDFRLGKASIAEMLRPQIKLPANGRIDDADSWGLGWAIRERNAGNLILHSGGQRGFRSMTIGSPRTRSGFVILTNGDNGGNIIWDEKVRALLDDFLA